MQSSSSESGAAASGGPANPIILIPSRLQSLRLPDKPLADIAGVPMIVHVMRRAEEADLGRVVVACAEPEIAEAVTAAGGEAVLTRPDHPSGSDRIYEALTLVDAEARHDAVINLQGDLPTLAADLPRAALELLRNSEVDIGTLATAIGDAAEADDPNVVKAVVSAAAPPADGAPAGSGRALYFTRSRAPSGDGVLWHHIGLYAYRRDALERFIALPPSPLESRERLEQLRALEAGMRIDVAFVDTVPLGVDTPCDLARARELMGARGGA
jgi:3-deoxy-manno-octulosonate cytidylyltransferase (CMP-KDO synthetase)